MSKFSSPIPILRSFDEKLTTEFYIDFLGFEEIFRHRFEPDLPLYQEVRLGHCILHLSQHFADATPGSSVRIKVDNVDAYCELLNAKKYSNARPGILRQDWGTDEMPITDPAGNRLIFYSDR